MRGGEQEAATMRVHDLNEEDVVTGLEACALVKSSYNYKSLKINVGLNTRSEKPCNTESTLEMFDHCVQSIATNTIAQNSMSPMDVHQLES